VAVTTSWRSGEYHYCQTPGQIPKSSPIYQGFFILFKNRSDETFHCLKKKQYTGCCSKFRSLLSFTTCFGLNKLHYRVLQFKTMLRKNALEETYVQNVQTPWSRVHPEKLTRPKLVKKFPAFYGTRWFITAFTRARHLSLSRARSIQSMPPSPIQPLKDLF
jgi:hypothetical protein